jgi:hypothetical protein
MDLWRKHFDHHSWREYLREALFWTEINDQIRKATRAGRFYGPEDIAKKLGLSARQFKI